MVVKPVGGGVFVETFHIGSYQHGTTFREFGRIIDDFKGSFARIRIVCLYTYFAISKVIIYERIVYKQNQE